MAFYKILMVFVVLTTALVLKTIPAEAAPCACSSVITTFCPYVQFVLSTDTKFGKMTILQIGGGTHEIHFCDCIVGAGVEGDACVYSSGIASGAGSGEFYGDGGKCKWKNCDDPPDTKICVDIDCDGQGQVTEPIAIY